MIKIMLCDDSEFDLNLIKSEIKKYSIKKHIDFEIHAFSSPEMLLYELEDGKMADIFILDVEMPHKNGFELAEDIRKYSQTAVILFLTSHEDQALNGYKSKALRYIIKMNLERDIEEALDCAISELENVDKKAVALHHYNDYWHILYKDIICVTRVSRQLVVSTQTHGEITDNRGIKEFFEVLNDNRFLFIDRSCFVNIDYISQISGYNLKLTTGELLPISRRSLQNVKQSLVDVWR